MANIEQHKPHDIYLLMSYQVTMGAGCRRDEIEAPEALGGIITTSFGPNKAPSGLTKARVSGEQAPLNPYGAPLTADGQSVRCCFLPYSSTFFETSLLLHLLLSRLITTAVHLVASV